MYPSWGHDIDKKTTPYDLNQEYRVDFDVRLRFVRQWIIDVCTRVFQKEFIGKKALLEQGKEGLKKRYVQFLLEDHNLDTDPW